MISRWSAGPAGQPAVTAAPPGQVPPAPAVAGTGRPLAAGLIALAGAAGFALLRLVLAAGGNVTEFARAAWPFAHRAGVPRGLLVFPGNGYDGQFYYRLALAPADLHRTAYGITMDAPYRLERIGYPALAWLVSLGRAAWVPAALVLVNVAAMGAIGLAGGILARDSGRHALWGLLLPGYFGFFMSIGNDLTEPVAAACLLGGVLAGRRGRPVPAGLLFACAALTRETLILVPVVIGCTRVHAWIRRAARPGAADAAWCLPALAAAAWQLVLLAATGQFVLLAGAGSNSGGWLPFRQFAGAAGMNLGLLVPPTGAAYLWFLEVAVLGAFVAAALRALRSAGTPGWERAAFLVFLAGAGTLSGSIWSGHADLRSIGEVYLFAVLILLAARRRLGVLALLAIAAGGAAAVHQALFLS